MEDPGETAKQHAKKINKKYDTDEMKMKRKERREKITKLQYINMC